MKYRKKPVIIEAIQRKPDIFEATYEAINSGEIYKRLIMEEPIMEGLE